MPLYEGIGLINEKLGVVLEIGRALTRAGFAGENCPRCIIPSVDPVSKVPLASITDSKKLYGALVDFLSYLYFKHLLVTPKDRKVVIVESLFVPTVWKETLARVLYLHFEIQNVLWVPSHLAGICGTGGESGLVVDVGTEEALVIPVVNGVTLLNAISGHELGAQGFDRNLKALLITSTNACHEAVSEAFSTDPESVQDLRVRACFISPRPAATHPPNADLKSFQIEKPSPSRQGTGTTVYLEFGGRVRVEAGEFWFQNEELDGISLPHMILGAILKAPIDSRKTLARSILLSGGTTMIPGFRARLLYELKNLSNSPPYAQIMNPEAGYEFRVFILPVAQNIVGWFGGSIYGSSEAMNLRGTTKEYYLKSNGRVPDWSNPSPTSPGTGSPGSPGLPITSRST